MTAKLLLVKSENGLETRQDYDGLSSANPAFTGTLTGGSAALTGDVDAGGEIKSGALVGTGSRPVVALADGTIDDQDAAMFRGTIGAGTSNLALGETSATAYRGDRGKAAYDHSQVAGNPHGTTAAQVGAAKASHAHSADDITSGILPTSRGGTGNESLPSGFLVSTNQRVQSMGLTNNTVPFFSGTTQGFWNLQFSSEFSFSSGSDPVLSLAGIAWSKVSKTGAVAADVGAAKAPSKVDISASTTIGSIDATAIKITATDVNLTLSGGVDGQGWDIVCQTTSFGISIPAGVTLYAYNGSDIGPTTRAVGGGRGIRIVRIDAATWIAPNLTW